MSYAVIELVLTDEQIAEIDTVIGETNKQFALLGHPQVRGVRAGSMPVYVLTAEQYKIIDAGVKEARALPAYEK